MRILKLSAYLAFVISLPLWLYFNSENELSEAKDKQKNLEAEKKENEKIIAAILANKHGQSEINFNSSHLDSLFYLIAKSNQYVQKDNSETSAPNPETERLLQELIKASIANASNINDPFSGENLKINISPIEINQKRVDNASATQNDFPIYDFSEKGPFKFWKIKLKREFPMRKEYFLVFNNISQTDTAYIYGISPADNWDTINSFNLPKDTTIIYPQHQFVVQYNFRKSVDRFYYVNGIFKGKGRDTIFKIPLIIGRDD